MAKSSKSKSTETSKKPSKSTIAIATSPTQAELLVARKTKTNIKK